MEICSDAREEEKKKKGPLNKTWFSLGVGSKVPGRFPGGICC